VFVEGDAEFKDATRQVDNEDDKRNPPTDKEIYGSRMILMHRRVIE